MIQYLFGLTWPSKATVRYIIFLRISQKNELKFQPRFLSLMLFGHI